MIPRPRGASWSESDDTTQVTKDAQRQGIIARDPAEFAEPAKTKRRTSEELDAWTRDEANLFCKHAAGDRMAACWLLTLCGLRRSEVLGLRWKDVDLDAGTITVTQGARRGHRDIHRHRRTQDGTRVPHPTDLGRDHRGAASPAHHPGGRAGGVGVAGTSKRDSSRWRPTGPRRCHRRTRIDSDDWRRPPESPPSLSATCGIRRCR
ncbi:tyrosine-type recombinase/integrase [Gordonia sp. TBRC 11910]|uniref:Tyrosine-type recombinase/integrase n=1 Tax=Gordonia asplenii TaxID=2725283 RepID=A0A848KUZ6_9ACTN|nr:tyrosine-type recombinase/integrase [Gordonia asplenii]